MSHVQNHVQFLGCTPNIGKIMFASQTWKIMSLSMAFQPDAFFLIGMGGFLVMGMGLKAGFNQQKLDGSTKNGQKQHTRDTNGDIV